MAKVVANSEPAATGGLPSGDIQHYIDNAYTLMGAIFSWAILLPTCVIIAGRYLAQIFPLPGVTGVVLRIRLFVFNIEANNEEVILGFTGFILTFGFVSLSDGDGFYKYAALKFGIDPGQFHLLCFSSAVLTVAWSVTLWRLTREKRPKQEQKQIEELINIIIAKIPQRAEHTPTETIQIVRTEDKSQKERTPIHADSVPENGQPPLQVDTTPKAMHQPVQDDATPKEVQQPVQGDATPKEAQQPVQGDATPKVDATPKETAQANNAMKPKVVRRRATPPVKIDDKT
jgi:hypothetical protein